MRKGILLACIAFVLVAQFALAQNASSSDATNQRFAFWYAPWTSDTWQKLQPANVFVGVPPNAVADIHQHGGKALKYVTYYQNLVGRDFLKTKADLDNVGFHTPNGYLLSPFGGKDLYVLCPNSAELHREVMASLDRILGTEGYDGLFVDNGYLLPTADMVCDAKHDHVKPGQQAGPAYIDLMTEVYASVKKHKPDSIVIVNPGNPGLADHLRDGNKRLWDVADYVLWESYAYSSMPGDKHDARNVALTTETPVPVSKVLALSFPKDDAEALNSYALARIKGYHFAANLGEDQKGQDVAGGHYGIFLADLPVGIGEPTSSMSKHGDLLSRDFQHGKIIFNSGSQPVREKAESSGTLQKGTEKTSVRAGSSFTLEPHEAAVITH